MPTETRRPTTATGSLFLVPYNAIGEDLLFSRVSARVPPAAAATGSLALTGLSYAIATTATISGVTISRAIIVEGAYATTMQIGITLDGSTFAATPTTIDLSSRGAVENVASTPLEYTITATPADINAATFGVLVQCDQAPPFTAGPGVDAVEISVEYLTGTLDAPTLSGSATADDHVLTWTEVSGATAYELEQSSTPPAVWSNVYTGTDLTFTVTALGVGASNSYRVQGTRALFTSTYSSTVALTTATLPDAPVIASITQPMVDAFSYTLGTLVLSWAAVGAAVSYDIQRRVDDGDWLTIKEGCTTTTYTDSTCRTVNDYDYRLRSNGTNVSGDWGDYVTGTVVYANAPDIDRQLKLNGRPIVTRS